MISQIHSISFTAQLEAALATFYAPKPPVSEVTIVEYRDPISRLARRFFHHLLRYARFDKAFLLAVDIGARDLFMVSARAQWAIVFIFLSDVDFGAGELFDDNFMNYMLWA